MYEYITRYTPVDKMLFLEDVETPGVVDEHMKPLVRTINEIPELVTTNCCTGGSLPYTAREAQERGKNGRHCPKTYVDFYVINHHYEVAHGLMAYIHNKFGYDYDEECKVWGSLRYEEDGYITEDNYFEPNGKTSLRFSIEGESPEVIPEITQAVEEYKELYVF